MRYWWGLTLIPVLWPAVLTAQTYRYPTITTTTGLSAAEVFKGGEVRVRISVDGATQTQTTPVPKQLVFILDSSESMRLEGRLDGLKDAALAIISTLDINRDQVSVVEFNDNANLLLPFSNNFKDAAQKIRSLGASGSTNYVAGLDLGIQQLSSATAPISYGIFLSDGMPNKGQDNDIQSLLKAFEPKQLPIYTVGVGSFDMYALQLIAAETGATISKAADPLDIKARFLAISKSVSNTLNTRRITIVDELAPPLRVVPSTFSHSFVGIGVSNRIEQDMSTAGNAFIASRTLVLPQIPELRSGQIVEFGYSITVDECDPSNDNKIRVHMPRSFIEYDNGSPKRQIASFHNPEIVIRQCGIKTLKVFSPEDRMLHLTLVNYGTEPVWDVTIEEDIDEASGFILSNPNSYPARWLPPPSRVSVNVNTHAYWDVPVMLGGEQKEFYFGLESVPGAPSGQVPIQHAPEARVQFNSLTQTDVLPSSNKKFPAVEANLLHAGGAGIAAAKDLLQFIQNRLFPYAVLTHGTVDVAPTEFQSMGLQYRITLAGVNAANLSTYLRQPIVFARLESDRIVFRAVDYRSEPIEQAYTPPNWVP